MSHISDTPKISKKQDQRQKLADLEKTLRDHYRAQLNQTIPNATPWMDQVMAQIQTEPLPNKPGSFPLWGFHEGVLFRFSGVAAAISAVILLLYFSLTPQLDWEMVVNWLVDPLTDIGLGWIGV